jgi:hypothetical protein
LAEQAGKTFSCPPASAKSTKRGGFLGALERLFVKVQRGELTADEAMAKAMELLGDEAEFEPDFIRDLRNALRNCPRHHQQQSLPFVDEVSDLDLNGLVPKAPRLPSTPRLTLGPPLQLRVEVWRESKGKRKQTRIIKL